MNSEDKIVFNSALNLIGGLLIWAALIVWWLS